MAEQGQPPVSRLGHRADLNSGLGDLRGGLSRVAKLIGDDEEQKGSHAHQQAKPANAEPFSVLRYVKHRVHCQILHKEPRQNKAKPLSFREQPVSQLETAGRMLPLSSALR